MSHSPTMVKNKSQTIKKNLLPIRLFLAEVDIVLLLCVVLLLIAGLSLTFISTFTVSSKLTGNPFFMASKQSITLLLGFSLMGFFCFYRIENLYKHTFLLFFLSIGLLLSVFVPGIGKEVSGASRWVKLFGLGFQPSEMVKVLALIILSAMLGKKLKKENSSYFYVGLPPFLVTVLFTLLIALQPDLSTALILAFTTILLFFSSKLPQKYTFINLGIVFPFVIGFLQSRRYYLERLLFFSPDSEPQGRGYHLLQSLAAFRRGKGTGEEIGASINHLSTLPDAHNDFIFSVIGNVSGVLGTSTVIGLFIVITARGLLIAIRQKNLSSHYLALSLTYLISLQAMFHMLVTTGLAPTTGIPLPFFSFGGSSMVGNCIMIGILLRLSRKKQRGTPS